MRHPIGRHNAGAGIRRNPLRGGALRFPAKHSDGSHEADGRASRGSTGSQARGEGIDCQWARLVPRSLVLLLPFPYSSSSSPYPFPPSSSIVLSLPRRYKRTLESLSPTGSLREQERGRGYLSSSSSIQRGAKAHIVMVARERAHHIPTRIFRMIIPSPSLSSRVARGNPRTRSSPLLSSAPCGARRPP